MEGISNSERQENELEILQAIFLDDIEDLRKTSAWKVWRPLDILIKLQPQQSMTENKEIHVSADLQIKCSEEYPNTIPSIFIKNGKGLSNAQMQELRKQLIELANKLIGEVMILDLTQHAQKFLHDNNKKAFQSFYEEMLQNQKIQEEEIALAERRRLESEQNLMKQQQKVIEEEINRKQEEIKEEFRKRKKSSLSESSSGSEKADKIGVRSKSSVSPQKELSKNQCKHSGVAILSYRNHSKRTVQRGECLGHSLRGSATLIGMDIDSGKTVAIIEWIIPCSSKNKHSSDIYKQISSIEQELAVISKTSHENLVPYLGLYHQTERDKILIYLFQEFVKGSSLGSYLIQNIPLDIALMRYYTKLIVEFLTYMHNNDVVHRDLRATSIFVDDFGRVKICDFTLDKRLFDLNNSYSSEPIPDLYPPTLGRGSKKGDVYRFGVIVLSLSLGTLVTDLAPKVPSTLPNDLQDFLKNCLHPNERERWTFSQLLSHPFLKHNPIQSLSLDVQSAKDIKNNELDATETDSFLLQVPNLNIDVGKQSRLYNEFEILNFLGSGGFGDVLKVRNRLDGRVYAIKRISLDPSRQQLNRKIMREVKLLSRLNHENIVRYYNSWIETSQQPVDYNLSSNSQSETYSNSNKAPSSPSSPSVKNKKEELKPISEEDLEKFAPPQVDISVEWSVSYEYSAAPVNDDDISSSSSSDDDEDDVYGSSLIRRTDSSDSVVFEGGDRSVEKSKEKSKSANYLPPKEESKELNAKPRCLQFMYIQMEFCEKSTLRQKIDNKLYEDLNLVWRLFREIIEGLVHIHQQGMIHRDLKPVNIFLDSNNHIKIGDFGLATTDIISKVSMNDNVSIAGQNSFCSINNSMEKSNLNLLGNENMTGRVGTALYVAPELISSNTKVVYNQKVDIYSLGIILFEMSYPAPSTGMERINLLSKLRQAEVILPDDAVEVMDHRQIFLIKRLLQHDVNKRPTAEELLTSDVLPPPQLEEAELDEMLRHTVSNPQSKGYKRMIATLFRQKTSPAADFTYDLDAYKGSNKYFIALNTTIETMERILKKHGAIKVTIPTLMPKCSLTESDSHVHFVDHGGGIVSLPSNLRVLFARYVARRDITQMKRYAIEKIYVERKVYGCHPREMYQCAFDLVTPVSNTLLPDAEVLAIASEILSEFPSLSVRNYYIRLNHLNLLKALLSTSQIPEEKHNDILKLLSEIKAKATCKSKLHDELLNLKISEQSISFLFRYIDVEDAYTKVDQILRAVTKKKSQAATLALQSLHEIQDVLKYAEMLGLKLPVVIAPGFVFGAPLYSGIVFQIVCELNKKDGKGKIDVIAVGGRYDKLVSSFRMNPSRDVNQFAVGFSLDLEKVINCELDNKDIASLYDAVLCSVGQKPMIKEKCSVLKNLWSCGIYTHVIYDSSTSLEEAASFCKENNINVLLILKENDLSNIKVRLYEKDRFTEKKFPLGEIEEYISKLRLLKSEQLDGQQTNRNELSRTSSSADTSEKIWTSQTPLIKITFVPSPADKTFTVTKKKRLEGLIMTNLSQSTCMQLISGKTCVEVICVDLVLPIIKTIISYIELDVGEAAFQDSLGSIIEKHHSHRKYLTKIFDVIHELKFEKNCQVIALYSSIDYVYKLLL